MVNGEWVVYGGEKNLELLFVFPWPHFRFAVASIFNHEGAMTQWSTKLTERHEWLGAQIVVVAVKVHKAVGPGLLESVYEKCFCHELEKRNIPYVRQKPARINYEEIVLDDALRLDILVDDLVVIELKAQENFNPVWQAQLLSYLRLTDKRLGYILNFHVPLMREGIRSMIL